MGTAARRGKLACSCLSRLAAVVLETNFPVNLARERMRATAALLLLLALSLDLALALVFPPFPGTGAPASAVDSGSGANIACGPEIAPSCTAVDAEKAAAATGPWPGIITAPWRALGSGSGSGEARITACLRPISGGGSEAARGATSMPKSMESRDTAVTAAG